MLQPKNKNNHTHSHCTMLHRGGGKKNSTSPYVENTTETSWKQLLTPPQLLDMIRKNSADLFPTSGLGGNLTTTSLFA